MSEEKQGHHGQQDVDQSPTEKIWDATVKTFHKASFRASQYKRIVQKKIDLNSIHKKISSAHGDLGKIVDERREAGVTDILGGQEVQGLFQRLDSLKQAAASLEEEIEAIQAEAPAEEEASSGEEAPASGAEATKAESAEKPGQEKEKPAKEEEKPAG